MVKRKTIREKIGKKEAKKLAGKDAVGSLLRSEDMETGSSIADIKSRRLKKKTSRKMQFLSKLQDTQSVLGAKKTISKKKHRPKKSPLNNLSSLADMLPKSEEITTPKPHQLHGRKQGTARQKLVVSESEQLSKVLLHPQFKSDPYTAVHEHLINSLGVKEGMSIEKGKRKEKKRRRKNKKKLTDMEE